MIDIQLLYNKKWNMKDKSKVLKTYGYMFDKLQFICLIGGGTRPNLGATRPRVGIANLGIDAPSWQYLKYWY